MRVDYDSEIKVAYVTVVDREIEDGEAVSQEVVSLSRDSAMVVFDRNEAGELLGVEVVA